MKWKAEQSLFTGGAIWLAAVVWMHPSPFHLKWGVLLLLLAALVAVPLAIQLILITTDETGANVLAGSAEAERTVRSESQRHFLAGRLSNGRWSAEAWLQRAQFLQLPAAVMLMISFALSESLLAGLLTLPWLLVTLLVCAAGVMRFQATDKRSPAELCLCAGMIFLSVGGIWALFTRLGLRPLGFDAVIVLLTALHFHYAGFLLPLLTTLAARRLNDGMADAAAWCVMAGVPLTALGITVTQISSLRFPETLAAVITASGGMLTALMYFRLVARPQKSLLTGMLWAVTAISLMFSMTLALLYGLRVIFPLLWLDIPLMRALHGSANALGFGLAGLLSWYPAASGRHCIREQSPPGHTGAFRILR